MSLALLVPAGCAKHADFVELREDLRTLTKSQETQQQRLQALETNRASEADKEVVALKQRISELTDRLKLTESRLARLEDMPSVAPAKPDLGKPDGGKGEPSRQSKPAGVSSPPPSMLPLPGTPDISPTSAYNLAYNDYLNGRYELAVSGFQRFLQDFPTASLVPSAQYWLGESYYAMKDRARAVQAFEKVITDYPHSDRVAPALYKLGLVAAETGDARRAREYLKRVMQDFKDSTEAKLAKGKLAEIR